MAAIRCASLPVLFVCLFMTSRVPASPIDGHGSSSSHERCQERSDYQNGIYTYDCEDAEKFPEPPSDAVIVIINEGNFDEILGGNFNGETHAQLKEIHLNDNIIDKIDRKAFDGLPSIEVIAFNGVYVEDVDDKAFYNLRSSLAQSNRHGLSISFENCHFEEIKNGAFHAISDVELLKFANTDIENIYDAAFQNIVMKNDKGRIEVTGVEVKDDDDEFNFLDVPSVGVIDIEHLTQHTLSKGLIGNAQQHRMVESKFEEIDENLADRDYDDIALEWSTVHVYCGHELEWLMEDKSSLPDEMLENLICSGPEELQGRTISDLELDEWHDGNDLEAKEDGDTSVSLIIGIIAALAFVILLIVLLVVFCKRKPSSNPPPQAVVAPAPTTVAGAIASLPTEKKQPPQTAEVVSGEDLPPPYNPRYDNPTGINPAYVPEAPPYSSLQHHTNTYDNPDTHPYAPSDTTYAVPDDASTVGGSQAVTYDNDTGVVKSTGALYDKRN